MRKSTLFREVDEEPDSQVTNDEAWKRESITHGEWILLVIQHGRLIIDSEWSFTETVCFLGKMVNLTAVARGRKPRLIYGVKRGKVPTKLRPHLLPTKENDGSRCSLFKPYFLNYCSLK